jgi:hypothetical protein
MPDDSTDAPDSPTINWVQVAAGALAAVTSAVLLSTVGVAGTLLGAALGSVAASVGSAVYGRGIESSHRRVAAQAAALRSVSKARDRIGQVDEGDDLHDTRVEAQLGDADHELTQAEQALQDDPDVAAVDDPAHPVDTAATSPWKNLPWKHIAAVAAGLFLVVMLAITVFEVVAGQSVSELTGGTSDGRSTTVPGLGDRDSSTQTPTESPSPTDDATTPSVSPTAEPTPTESPTPTDDPTTSTPEPTATDEPTPTEAASPDQETTDDAGQGLGGGDEGSGVDGGVAAQ